jgi:D-alanine transaminase
MSNVYLNGATLPLEQACIPVMDRGFLFGDGIYEVIPVYGGRLFRLQEHLTRLNRSLDAIGITNPHSDQQWQQILDDLISNSDHGDELTLYLQITRGAGTSRDHAIPADISPTVFAMASATKPPTDEQRQQGVSCITAEDIRWLRCDIKAITLLPAVLMRQQAAAAGAADALLVRDGQVTEGSVTSLFAIVGDTLVTPPQSHLLLPGVTRELVLELAAQANMTIEQRAIPLTELYDADELWITGSTKEVLAVVEVDGKPIGTGQPGPHFQQMLDRYRAYKQAFREHTS